MTVILIRTVIFYVVLTAIMRMMGKRQIGELQVSEFVTAFLISEMAALPMTDMDIPLLHGLTAIGTLASLETVTAFFCRKSVFLRRMINGEPVILMSNGHIDEKALTRARVSLDEIFAQVRNQGYKDIGEVQYIILEQTGKMSIIPKSCCEPLTPAAAGIDVAEPGLSKPVIVDGKVSKCFMGAAGISTRAISDEARKAKVDRKDILYMTVDDAKSFTTVKKEEK